MKNNHERNLPHTKMRVVEFQIGWSFDGPIIHRHYVEN